MSRTLLLAPLALFSLCHPGCASAPAPAPSPIVVASAKPPTRPPPDDAQARWLVGGRPTFVGPRLAEGRFVLLGGSRALVKPDGTVLPETSPMPEPIEQVVEIATASRRVLIARSSDTLYRLDDPLGVPTPIAHVAHEWTEPWRIGSGPGLIALWDAARGSRVQDHTDTAPTVRFFDPDQLGPPRTAARRSAPPR